MSTGIAGVSLLPLGFGTHFFDYDNDGDLDLFVANGHIFPNVKAFSQAESYLQADQIFRNTDGRFEVVSAGIEVPGVSRRVGYWRSGRRWRSGSGGTAFGAAGAGVPQRRWELGALGRCKAGGGDAGRRDRGFQIGMGLGQWCM